LNFFYKDKCCLLPLWFDAERKVNRVHPQC